MCYVKLTNLLHNAPAHLSLNNHRAIYINM